MNLGIVKEREPEERRILFEDPRLETIPTDHPAVGEIPIFISREILEGLLQEVAEKGTGGGLILGDYSIGNGIEFLEIGGLSAAPAADGVDIPFTARDWEAIFKGWLESHPDSFGIGWWRARKARSSMQLSDRAFHKAFFPLSWQIALLVDSTSKTGRFHQWKHGRIEECGYFVVQPRRT